VLQQAAEPWPTCDYSAELQRRSALLLRLRRRPELWREIKSFYRSRPVQWARDWGITYDPRNVGSTTTPAFMPFVPFRRQIEHIQFIYLCVLARASGLIEKSRDMGATWDGVYASCHMWLFWDGPAIGWGSRKAALVDKLGDPDSIFEKVRIQIRSLPPEMLPRGFSYDEHMNLMRVINPETGASITGEAGDDIGRGGRKLVYFKDESAHYEHPDSIEASLQANTEVQIDISSVNGIGNVFHRRREGGAEWTPGAPLVRDRTNVFIMDWRHHPGKTQAWYDEKRAKHEADGLLKIFAQEVDRDYAASVEGTVIPAEWVRSAIDAHVLLKFRGTGAWCGALDVADEGSDTNALIRRRGVIVRSADEWGDRDTGATTRKAIDACSDTNELPLDLQYDSVGVGAGVKAEYNRLAAEARRLRHGGQYEMAEKLLPSRLRLAAWSAGAAPLDPERRLIPNDPQTPKNEDFFGNLKAQAWWQLRRRFELTHKAVTQARRNLASAHQPSGVYDDFVWDEEDLVSLPSNLPLLWKLVRELSQATMSKTTGKLKLIIDKAPDGTKSPNLADACVMCFWPMRGAALPPISKELLARI
jgi:phage terminase large subunit